VRTFGVKGDGKALDSPAINKAIEAAAKTGGGTVFSLPELTEVF
jgi:polygalacturonase